MTLSDISQNRLATVAPILRDIVYGVADQFPLVVVCGHRTKEAQDEACRLGRSKTPWPTSKHNTNPSVAVDLAPLKDGAIDWNDSALFRDLANRMLFAAKAKGVDIRWGGDWDRDGKTRSDGDADERFVDLPHFELAAAGYTHSRINDEYTDLRISDAGRARSPAVLPP